MTTLFYIVQEEGYAVIAEPRHLTRTKPTRYGLYHDDSFQHISSIISSSLTLEKLAEEAILKEIRLSLPNKTSTLSAPIILDDNAGSVNLLKGISERELMQFYQHYLQLLGKKR